ncbi:MAG: nitrous oxide reductase accessory protein NosL [Solirubrobacterales bacterium]
MRTALALVVLLMVGACGDKGKAPPPPPAAMGSDAVGHYCGMTLADHPGPKGQIQVKSRKEPYWFSSARDTLAFTMLPEEPKDIAAIYVTAMDKAASWEQPGQAAWVDAHAASYVVGSDAKGGMGQNEVVPFTTPEAAEAFARQHGGQVYGFDRVPHDKVLGEDTPAVQSHEDGHQGGSHP